MDGERESQGNLRCQHELMMMITNSECILIADSFILVTASV